MRRVLYSIFTIIMTAEFTFGNLSNGFIVLTNCTVWIRKRKLSSVDQILSFLAISRIGLIWEMLLCWLKTLQYSFSFMSGTELRVLMFTWALSNHFSLWLATILSIFYLLKIAHFSWPVFLYLKWRVRKVLLMVLLGTLAILLLNLIQMNQLMEDWMHQYERNTTWISRVSGYAMFSDLIVFKMIMFSLTPFTMATISFLLLIFSLWKHLRQMQLNFQGHRDPSTKAHANALRIMVSFLLLYASYFMSFFIPWLSKTYQNGVAHMFCLTIGLFYPSAHSFILILGNSNLRNAYLLVLKQLRYRLKY